MLQTEKLDLVLEFETGLDSLGDPIVSKVKLSNLRVDLTHGEITQLVTVFSNLVNYPLNYAYVLATQSI